jgi:hypothetical protein
MKYFLPICDDIRRLQHFSWIMNFLGQISRSVGLFIMILLSIIDANFSDVCIK